MKNSKLQINLALNYGSKLELINAFKKIERNKIKINEKNLEKHLQTKNIPDPDILIRTGIRKDWAIFYYGNLLIQKFSLKKNYGQHLLKKITLKLLKSIKILKEILEGYD